MEEERKSWREFLFHVIFVCSRIKHYVNLCIKIGPTKLQIYLNKKNLYDTIKCLFVQIIINGNHNKLCFPSGCINLIRFFGSSALSGKILLVRIIENNKIDAYFRAC